MNFIIRKGLKTDMQSVLKLIMELAIFEKEPNAVEIALTDLINDGFSTHYPKFKTFVAEQEGTIIGMALFYERYSTWKGVSIHLEDLIVTESKRGIGVGKALYTAVLKYAFNKGCKRVSWDVLDWNMDAINFYKKTGASILKEWKVVHMTEKNLKNYIEKSS